MAREINHLQDLKTNNKDKDWYISQIERNLPYGNNLIPDYERIIRNYQIYNGDLSSIKKEIKNFCDPAGIEIGKEDIKAFPKLHNNIEILKGEKLKRNENFKILILSTKAIRDKNEKLLEALTASVDEKITLKVQELRMKLEGQDPSVIEEEIEKLRTQESPEDILDKNFLSEWEIFYSKAIKYMTNDQDVKTKQMFSLEDALLQDKFFVYVGFEYGKPCIKVRNVASTIHHKSPNEMRIHKGEYVGYVDAITPTEAFALYEDELTTDELNSLGNRSKNSIRDRRHNILQGKAKPIKDTFDDDMLANIVNVGSLNDKSQGMFQDKYDYTDDLIIRSHYEFKAFERVIYLTYTDQMGEEITTIVKRDFEIPEDAEKVRFTNTFGKKSIKYIWMVDGEEYIAEPLYIPRKYEVTRLNGDIYVNYREVPFQVTNLENPFSEFELSTKGIIFTARNADSISMFERALPLYMQYLYVKHIQNRELSKYQGYIQDIDVDQIPDALGKDVDGNMINDPIQVSLLYQKKLGKNFYSGSQTMISGMSNPQQSPGSKSHVFSTANEIYNLQNLLELIDREMSLVMGISPQRASDFSSNTNVSDNQQAIAQSHHITEPFFYLHSIGWKDIIKEYLKCFRTYAEKILLQNKDSHTLSYILPDGTKELFEVTRKAVELVDMAIYVTNTGQEQEYLELMKSLAQPFSQNQGQGMTIISALLKSITSGASPEEVHKQIKMEERAQQKRLEEQQQLSLQAEEKAKQMAREDLLAVHERAKELVLIEVASKEKIAAMNNTSRQEEKDADRDGVPDYLEIYKLGQEADLKAKELEQKDRELNQKDTQMENEKEKSKAELKIKEKEIKAKAKTTNN